MCGRFLLNDDAENIREILSELDERHRVSLSEVYPTNVAPIINQNGDTAVKWGFPQWKGSGVIINARAETALEKSTFRKHILERRCVIPCSGYFEWKQIAGKKKKDKYFLNRPGDGVLYLAGVYGRFRDAGGDYDAFVILTTAANDSMETIHSRMPVIIDGNEQEAWLGDVGFMEHVLSRVGPDLCFELEAGI